MPFQQPFPWRYFMTHLYSFFFLLTLSGLSMSVKMFVPSSKPEQIPILTLALLIIAVASAIFLDLIYKENREIYEKKHPIKSEIFFLSLIPTIFLMIAFARLFIL
jgi:hypothetical protein